MRLQDDFFLTHAAPRARVSVSRFHEVDRPLVFRSPCPFNNTVPSFIHLNEAAWRQNWIHGEIFGANVSVSEIAGGELRQIGDGNESPLLDHASEIRRATLVKSGIHANGNLDR